MESSAWEFLSISLHHINNYGKAQDYIFMYRAKNMHGLDSLN